MPIPADYFYKDGFYWKRDETGPYIWNGTTMELVGAGGGAGGGASSGGGSDRTAVVTEADPVNGGLRILSETVNGITITYGYDVYGRLSTRSALSGNLSATINYPSPSTDIASSVTGNRFVRGDTWVTTASQMAAIKSALITAALTDETPTFYVEDFDSNRGLWLEWDSVNQGFRGVGGAPILVAYRNSDDAAGAWTGSVAESGDRWTATIPGWLRHLNSALVVMGDFSSVNGGTPGTKTLRLYHGGVNSHNAALSSTQNNLRFAGRWTNRNSLSAQVVSNSGGFDGYGASSVAAVTGTVATGSDTVVAIRYILANSGDSIIFNSVRAILEN